MEIYKTDVEILHTMNVFLCCPDGFHVCLLAFNTKSNCSHTETACKVRGNLSVVTRSDVNGKVTILSKQLRRWEIDKIWIAPDDGLTMTPHCRLHSVLNRNYPR